MLKIRLQRVGRKHEPSFRLVLTDSKNSTKSGRLTEVLGNYDPRKSIEVFKADRIKHWVGMGAGLTGTVNNILIKKGIIRGQKVHVGMDHVVKASEPTTDNSQPTTELAPESAPAAVPETPVEETPVEVAPVEENSSLTPETPVEIAPETASQ